MREQNLNAGNSEVIFVWQAIRKHKVLFIMALAFSVVIGIGVTSRMKDVVEATALVKIGQVAYVSANDQLVTKPVESIDAIEVRIHSLKLNFLNADPNEVALIRRSLVVKKILNSDLFQLKVRAYSQKGASDALLLTVKELSEVHSYMMQPSIDNTAKKLDELQRIMKESKNFFRRCFLIAGQGSINNRRFDGAAENSCFKEAALFEDRKSTLQEAVSTRRTYTTYVEGEISSYMAGLSRVTIVGVAFFIGLMLTLLLVVYLERRRV